MNPEQFMDRIFKQPLAIIVYGLLTTLAALLIWWTIPQEHSPIPFVLLPLFISFLLFARVWTIGLLVLLFLVVLTLNEPPSYNANLQPEAILFAEGMLVFVLSACRFYVCSAPLVNVKQKSAQRTKLFSWEHWKRPRVANSLRPRDSAHFSVSELMTGLLRALFTMAIVLVLLWLVPLNLNSVQEYRLTPSGLRAILLGVALFFVVLVTNGILGLFSWKRLTPAESRVYLQSLLTEFLHTDLRMVIKRKLKLRRLRMKG